MKKLWEEFQYFFQQKIYVIILCLTAICGYGFEMTHPSIGIDDTAVSLYLEDGLEVVMGRWFIYLINKIFHLSDFSPFMMELIGVILLCISATFPAYSYPIRSLVKCMYTTTMTEWILDMYFQRWH